MPQQASPRTWVWALISIRFKRNSCGVAVWYFDHTMRRSGRNAGKWLSLMHAIQRAAFQAHIVVGD